SARTLCGSVWIADAAILDGRNARAAAMLRAPDSMPALRGASMTHGPDPLTSIASGVMYGVAQPEGAAKERRNADREQRAGGGDRADGAVQEAGPDVRGGGDARRRALPPRRRHRAPEPVVP